MAKRKCKFIDRYLEEFNFIKKGRIDEEAYCKVCNQYLNIAHGGKTDSKDHENTNKHKKNMKSSVLSMELTHYFTQGKRKSEEDRVIASELTFAYHTIKYHQSFNSMECTNKLLPQVFNDSKLAAKFSSARTKSTKLITNVLAPHAIDRVIEEMKNVQFYSISTDASNHKAEKMFPLILQYFTMEGTQVKLLCLGNLKNETANTVAGFYVSSLEKLHIDIKKCIAFGGDNVNVNFGGLKRQGMENIFTKLKSSTGNEMEGIGCL